ncbi:MAG: DUF748 domain-containing protein [Candidatus Omnitrophica bacterium]|nr:DUF748 domain-containing protein [Candidatus Omnitrophota bacterium]
MGRRLLLFLALLVALGLISLAVFIATFDADRYRPMVVAQLEKELGRPVTLQRLSLAWRGGIALQLQGFKVEPLIDVPLASALVRLKPLLRRQVQVVSVALERPTVHVVRDAEGDINLLGLALAAAPAAPAAASRQDAFSFSVSTLQIRNGTLHWLDESASPPAELWLRQTALTLKNISAAGPIDVELAGALESERPNLRLQGRLVPPQPGKASALENLQVSVQRLPLGRVLPQAPAPSPQLAGTLSLSFTGVLPDLDPIGVVLASGDGTLRLEDAVLERVNVLRVVFAQLSMIPGLVESLQQRLPPEYQAKLTAPDTIFQPVELAVRLQGAALHCENVRLATDTFEVAGGARLGLDGTVAARLLLSIDPELSAAVVGGVNELEGLVASSGRMEIPVSIQGRPPHVAVLPDLQYVASRVLVRKAVDVLGRLLAPELDAQAPPPGQAQAGEPQQKPSKEELIGTLLQRVLHDEE